MNFRHCLVAAAAATVLVGAHSTSAQAFTFSTEGIRFERETKVNFTFFESHGAYQSSLAMYQVSNGIASKVTNLFHETRGTDNNCANECKGSFGNAVTSLTGSQTESFNFQANQLYTLGLASTYGRENKGTVYSTTALNPFGRNRSTTQQAVFGSLSLLGELNRNTTASFAQARNRTAGNPFAGSVAISFDDRGNRNDTDFQDFTVTAEAEAVPEPATLAGLGLIAGAIAASRRKQEQPLQ